LKTSLEKLQADYSKLTSENEEMMKKNSLLQEEITTLKSKLRETEMSKDMLDRDVTRLTQDVQHLRDSLNKRDEDFRSSMASTFTIQRQVLEEKNALNQEISQWQHKSQLLEEEKNHLTAQIAHHKEEFSLLSKDYDNLKDQKLLLDFQLQEKRGDSDKIKELSMQLEIERELKNRSEYREENERRERIAAVAQLIAIQNESMKSVKEMETKLSNLENIKNEEICKITQEKEQITMESKSNMEMNVGLKEEIQQLHYALEKAPINHSFAEELSKAHGEIEILKQKLIESHSQHDKLLSIDHKRIQEYEEKLLVSETARRKLHNLVQELRGNIRVFARVRPFLPSDGHELNALPEPAIHPRNDLNSLKISRCDPQNPEKIREDHEFAFDKVFGQSVSQETLFHEVAEFVQSALDGYNVCLFSYGQTGSGKTHTMNGSGDGSMRGIIPRAMEQVGAYKRQLQEKGWNYHMEISFIEIYNETIRDLLRTSNAKDKDGDYTMKHDIKKDAQGNFFVTDINKMVVDPEDFQQIMSIMELASQYRSTSSTLMNDRSSRSHAIFTLHLKAHNPVQGIELNGALNLVDLAGSERIDKSGVTGHELKEAVAINKSLSSLADVFNALANKQSHIPFRNSKLTYLLQPALSGDGKTLMVRKNVFRIEFYIFLPHFPFRFNRLLT
jgi:kinesin family protein C1